MPPHQLNYGNQLSSDSFVEVSTLSIRELKTSQRVLMLEKYILLLDILAKVNEILGYLISYSLWRYNQIMKGNLEPGRQTLRNFCNENTDKKLVRIPVFNF